MINYTPTPDYYNEYICHYNHNHDPKNGQFTSGNGGSSASKNKYGGSEWFDDESKMEKYLRDLDSKGRGYSVRNIEIDGKTTGYEVKTTDQWNQRRNEWDYGGKEGDGRKILPSTEKPKNSLEKDVQKLNVSGDNNNNCTYCSLAYEMRRRNLDVTVTKKANEQATTKEVYNMYNMDFSPKNYTESVRKNGSWPGDTIFEKNKKPKVIRYPSLIDGSIKACKVYSDKEITRYMKNKYPEGARGVMLVPWARPKYMYGIDTGHCISWELKKGKLNLIDPQANSLIKDKNKFLESVDCYDLIEFRTDDKVINKDYIKKVV